MFPIQDSVLRPLDLILIKTATPRSTPPLCLRGRIS